MKTLSDHREISSFARGFHARIRILVSLTIPKTLFTQEKQKAEAVFSETVNLKEAMLESKDVAEATLYLASDESQYVSGLNLVADGVYSTTNPTFGEAMKKLSS
ncbi:hypothetical protein ACSBR1_017967 [Camellia fascicularis]